MQNQKNTKNVCLLVQLVVELKKLADPSSGVFGDWYGGNN